MNTATIDTSTKSSAWFCCGCGKHTALAPTDRPGLLVAVEYGADGFTPTTSRHVCPPREVIAP